MGVLRKGIWSGKMNRCLTQYVAIIHACEDVKKEKSKGTPNFFFFFFLWSS